MTSEDTSDAASAAAGQPVPVPPGQRRNPVWRCIHVVVYLACRLWCRTKVIGREHLDDTCGGILLINHQSYLDPLFTGVGLSRPVSFLARDSVFKVPFIGWVCRNTYVIPISRTAFRGGSIRAALERLEQGYLVGIYPEGTRSPGPPGDFRPGFLALARRTNLPIYPVAIIGADKVMPRNAWFIRPKKVTVVFGKPLSQEDRELLNSTSDDRAVAAQVRGRVLTLYQSIAEPGSAAVAAGTS